MPKVTDNQPRRSDLILPSASARGSLRQRPSPGGTAHFWLYNRRVRSHYLNAHRQQEFLDNLCRKMLAYALGRTLLLSDDVTIDNMRAKLAANGYHFRRLLETIVTSPQFLTRRIPDEMATR